MMEGLESRLAEYSAEQLYHIAFLRGWLGRQKRDKDFDDYLDVLAVSYTPGQLEQIVKCITHDISFELLVYKDLDEPVMNEIRRYTEDVTEKSLDFTEYQAYLELGRKLLDYTQDAHMVYQFRRFLKQGCSCDFITRVLDMCLEFEINNTDWPIICFFNSQYDRLGEKCLDDGVVKSVCNLYKLNKNDNKSLEHFLVKVLMM